MTQTPFEQVHDEITRVVKRCLDSATSQLAAAGISAESPELEVSVPDAANYTSEIRVYFRRAEDVIDVLEFHIFEAGKPVVTRADVERWLPEQIKDVADRVTKR